ncbi:MAG TPA: TIGR02206 family membrane protein [bacterium]
MPPRTFIPFGADHVSILVLIGLAAGAAAFGRRGLRRSAGRDRVWRRSAAALLLVNELSSWGVALASGVARVPCQLCDVALLLTVWGLWTLRGGVCRLAYFWALAGSLQAILTPDLARGFPDYWWIKFFITHGGVVVAAVYLAVTGRVAATTGSVWRVWALTNAYAAAAGALNWLQGTNYGYLAAKPSQPSLLDWLGPWPYYIVGMDALALGFLFLCYGLLKILRGMPAVGYTDEGKLAGEGPAG